ncbi:hypothetical protein G6514_002219 [Epicoccum nigrum]|nr:hypothetical protein G6514_002219 [Epicoccum nigrum]
MSKRSAPSSPSLEPVEVKKQKMGSGPVEAYAPTLSPTTQSAPFELPEGESTKTEATKTYATKTTPNNPTKRKAGDGFTLWTPPRALEPLPELQPHWGIVPRHGGYERPLMPQPPARDSDGSIRPPLWEDRKGAVRVKRGSRFVDGYDQADHMWLPLMDVRPVSTKNQQPRRKVIGYWYPHGMPADWNNSTVLNDVNKALQEAIKSNSNKDAPYNLAERQVLAKIFAEDPEISLLDAAELFNERAHPVTGSEEGSYPTGRFTESIQHEFRSYQSVYVKGEVPTATTPKESALEEHYEIWKAEQKRAEIDAKKEAKAAAKAEKQAAKEAKAKAKAAAEEKEARTKAKAEKEADKTTKKPRAKKRERKMSETAGVTKKRSTKQPYSTKTPFTMEEMLARAEATGLIIEKRVAAEEAAAAEAAEKAAQEAAETETDTETETATVPTTEQTATPTVDETVRSGEGLPQSPGVTVKKSRAKKTGKKMSDSAGVTKKYTNETRIADDEEMCALAAEIIRNNAAEKAAKEAAKKAVKQAKKIAAEKAAAEMAAEMAGDMTKTTTDMTEMAADMATASETSPSQSLMARSHFMAKAARDLVLDEDYDEEYEEDEEL